MVLRDVRMPPRELDMVFITSCVTSLASMPPLVLCSVYAVSLVASRTLSSSLPFPTASPLRVADDVDGLPRESPLLATTLERLAHFSRLATRLACALARSSSTTCFHAGTTFLRLPVLPAGGMASPALSVDPVGVDAPLAFDAAVGGVDAAALRPAPATGDILPLLGTAAAWMPPATFCATMVVVVVPRTDRSGRTAVGSVVWPAAVWNSSFLLGCSSATATAGIVTGTVLGVSSVVSRSPAVPRNEMCATAGGATREPAAPPTSASSVAAMRSLEDLLSGVNVVVVRSVISPAGSKRVAATTVVARVAPSSPDRVSSSPSSDDCGVGSRSTSGGGSSQTGWAAVSVGGVACSLMGRMGDALGDSRASFCAPARAKAASNSRAFLPPAPNVFWRGPRNADSPDLMTCIEFPPCDY
eukprot:m.735673 g.735673  ORF g.735673 m.735673 type:complete len:415 (+) comp23092_c0_seq2:2991-4235(+)